MGSWSTVSFVSVQDRLNPRYPQWGGWLFSRKGNRMAGPRLPHGNSSHPFWPSPRPTTKTRNKKKYEIVISKQIVDTHLRGICIIK